MTVVHHRQNTFHLAAEIGVSGRIDNVEAQIVVQNRSAFGENGDAALALKVIAVHGALGHLLIIAESAGLAKHSVNQCRFAVVDVGDDGYVTECHVSFAMR